MRSYEDALAAAADEPAFSNGTEGECWMDNWCYRCAVDLPFQQGKAIEGCPLIMVAYMGKTPVEWINRDSGNLGNQFHCTEYRPIDDGGGGAPEPEPRFDPVMPGQIDLFTAVTLDQIETALSKPREVHSGRR